MNKASHLALWGLHAKLPGYRRMVGVAGRAVEAARATGARFSLSWSGGKDSTAMVHLVRSVWPECPVIAQCDDCDWPGHRKYLESTAAVFGWEMHVCEPGFSVWEAIANGPLTFQDFCSQDHWLTQASFLAPMERTQAALGCDAIFMGLRAEESRARRMNAYTRGMLYLKNGQWRSCPLLHWGVRDVFAYHVANGIPIHPFYFFNAVHPPESLRLCWALPSKTGIRYGDMEHLRRHYPQQFARLRGKGAC